MERKFNLTNLEEQGLGRNNKYNPLYDLFKHEFDKAFKSEEVNVEYVLDHYYIDGRTGEDVTMKDTMAYISKKLNINRASDLSNSISKNEGKLFLLIGKKGIGKTTLLRFYERQILQEFSSNNRKVIFIYLDLKNKKLDQKFLGNLPSSIMIEMSSYIIEKVPNVSRYLRETDHMRKLNPLYAHVSNEYLATRFLEHNDVVMEELLLYLKTEGYQLFIVVDNIDDYSILNVKAILDKCQIMREKYSAKCIISLRDHWNPKTLRIDDRTIAALNLLRPNIREIIIRRLEAVNEAIKESPTNEAIEIIYNDERIILTCDDIIGTFKIICSEFTDMSNRFYRELYRLSNYDIRDLLENIYHFFHSPYLYSRPNYIRALIEKMEIKDDEFSMGRRRNTRFFDFLTGFMTPHSLCYDFENSKIFNIFYHDYKDGIEPNYKNTLIYIRILENVPEEGFLEINKEDLTQRVVELGYDKDRIEDAITKLLEESLLDSPDGRNYLEVQDISLSAKGKIYLKKLINEFTYLLFICDRVPMPKGYLVDIHRKFEEEPIPLKRGQLNLKIESVRNFLDFLQYEEFAEYNNVDSDYRWRLNKKGELYRRIANIVEGQIIRIQNSNSQRSVKKITGVKKIVI